MLRMATAPPIARDRLIGLAQVSYGLVRCMELDKCIPPTMKRAFVKQELQKVGGIITRLADKDIFSWLESGKSPTEIELHRAATIVADRLCGAVADPIIRNAQEQRQLAIVKKWLEQRGYSLVKTGGKIKFNKLKKGTFAFRMNVPIQLEGGKTSVNIPIDIVIKPLKSKDSEYPLLIEAKSAGDFTNTNKRRKEEALKMAQLRRTYGNGIRYFLLLCGYFDAGYLGYEASEGIDWVWEHRLDDLSLFGI